MQKEIILDGRRIGEGLGNKDENILTQWMCQCFIM